MTRTKRAVDVVSSAAGLIVLAPFFAIIALVVALDGGPVFFRHERVGQGGRRFRMLKFRTMRPHAERLGLSLTVAGDPRVTPVGRWLRRSKLDELPQLVNVLLGDMSLVGPRPEVPRYVALYTSEENRVLDLAPGITDPASIAYRDEEAVLGGAPDPERHYIETVMREKIRLNLAYADRASVWSDVGVVLRTVGEVLRGTARTQSVPVATRRAPELTERTS